MWSAKATLTWQLKIAREAMVNPVRRQPAAETLSYIGNKYMSPTNIDFFFQCWALMRKSFPHCENFLSSLYVCLLSSQAFHVCSPYSIYPSTEKHFLAPASWQRKSSRSIFTQAKHKCWFLGKSPDLPRLPKNTAELMEIFWGDPLFFLFLSFGFCFCFALFFLF